MTLYWTIFGVISFSAFLDICSNKNKFNTAVLNTIFISCLCVLLILSSIRWETGTDWPTYLEAFNRTTDWEDLISIENLEFESGFLVLNIIAHWVGNSYNTALFLQGLIIYIFMYLSFKEESPLPIVSLMIYYSMSLAGMFFVRQTIAILILLYATKYIISGQLKKFILVVIIASLFHRTSLLYLPAYWIYSKQWKWRTLWILMLASIVLGLGISKVILKYIASLDLGIVSIKLMAYLDLGNEDNSTIYSTTGIILRGAVNRGLLFLMYWFFLRKKRSHDPIINGLININFLGCVLFCLTSPIALSLSRVTSYYDMAQVIIFPYILIKMNLKNRLILFPILLLYSSFRLYTALTSYSGAYVPYKSIL